MPYLGHAPPQCSARPHSDHRGQGPPAGPPRGVRGTDAPPTTPRPAAGSTLAPAEDRALTTHSPKTLVQHAARQLQRLVALTAAVAATAAFAKAPDAMVDLPRFTTPAPVSYATAVPAKAQSYKIAHEQISPDINGDGQADFVNPTGKSARGEDAYGSGHFGASRGGRGHEGVDYVAEAGQQVLAPIAGFVTRVGYAYRDSFDYRYVEITNRMTGYTARVMYVGPEVQVGQTLALGQVIGRAQSLERRYPNGITNHIHLEIARLDGRQLDAARLIPASA